MRWLGFDWARAAPCLGLLRGVLPLRAQADRGRQGLRVRPERRTGARVPRHADRARAQFARSASARWRKTSTCSSACAPANSPTARAPCARRSTWPRGNINLRDPAIYRIRHVSPPEHRRRLADLPDVRLRALHLGRGRGHHAFAVHAGIRGPPAAVRLVHRPASTCRAIPGSDEPLRAAGLAAGVAPAADRVLAPATSITR